jgi:hypothetical protein
MERFEDNKQDVENNISLTLEDVAGILDVDVNTVIHLSNLRILKGFRVGPHSEYRFRMDDVVAFLMEKIKGELRMEKPKDEVHDKRKRNSMKLDYIVSTFDTHVDEAKTLVEAELLPYVYKYTELCSNPRPESRFREEDFRFLLLK